MKILTIKVANYSLINESLYKIGNNDVLHQCSFPHELKSIINEAHARAAGGHFQAETTTNKIFQAGLWWPTLSKDYKSQLQK